MSHNLMVPLSTRNTLQRGQLSVFTQISTIMVSYHLAIDIGASSGRLILSHLEDGHFVLEEVYRFPNGIWRKKEGALWDYDALYSEMIKGFKLCHSLKKDPSTIGVDTWGVDYVLLDENDEPIKPFFAYRDPRGIAASAIAHGVRN